MALDPVIGPLSERSLDPTAVRWMKHVPRLPAPLRRVRPAPIWPRSVPFSTPASLRTVPGIWRDRQVEEEAFAARPLHDFMLVHSENLPLALRHSWHFLLPAAPEMAKALARKPRLAGIRGARPACPRSDVSARELTDRIRVQARRLGISAVGFAPYDPKYTFAEYADHHDRGSVIVCAYEQDWQATQTAPSARSERAAFRAYAALTTRSVALAEFVERQGFRAQPHSFTGEAVAIHYGVQAGLGQLGLNGQLLTPAAGSRARLSLITTDAELIHDEPVDYGIHAICDACQACVRRCPVGAIPKARAQHRGVRKIKIKTERCFPVVVSAEGCAVCMKVCPVQRYGLEAVVDHYARTGGEILGKGSEELEGYVWPLDGRRYGPGEKPDAAERRKVLNPPHWRAVDPTRTEPVRRGEATGGDAPPSQAIDSVLL